MPHTPGYQPVEDTSNIFSKFFTQSFKSRNEFIKKYIEDEEKDKDVKKIVNHTIGEAEPLYDLKRISKILKSIQ